MVRSGGGVYEVRVIAPSGASRSQAFSPDNTNPEDIARFLEGLKLVPAP
jgi:hypothetical protein